MAVLNYKMATKQKSLLIFVSFLILLGSVILVSATQDDNSDLSSYSPRYGQTNGRNGVGDTMNVGNGETHTVMPLESTKVSNNPTTTESLLYIIEEEKLAHDVYQVMYELWGSRVFGNIRNSETSHQNQVLTVMENRNITDPRSDKIGVFRNQSLQKLYDELIAQGSKSATESFRVGVAIEELDIQDLKDYIDNLDPADTDVRVVYESLLRGSERHLRAFNRQLSR